MISLPTKKLKTEDKPKVMIIMRKKTKLRLIN